MGVKVTRTPLRTFEVSIAITDANGSRGASTLVSARTIGEINGLTPDPLDGLMKKLGYGEATYAEDRTYAEDSPSVTALSISMRQVY